MTATSSSSSSSSAAPLREDSSSRAAGAWCAAIGTEYKSYAEKFVNHAVDGEILSLIAGDRESDALAQLADIGIANKLHQRKIFSSLKKVFAKPNT
jgi:hypothetical protein